jgi:hypothetical protein
MRNLTLAVVPLVLAVSAPVYRKGWTPERRKLQTRTCIDAYWDVHPEVTRTLAYLREVEDYCVCVTDQWAKRVDCDDVVKGRAVFAVLANICRRRVGLK